MVVGAKVGDVVKFEYRDIFYTSHLLEKPIVHIFKAYVKPREEDIYKYYQIDSEHPRFKFVCKKLSFDRLVLKKNVGHYLVIPNTTKLRGSITKKNREVVKMNVMELVQERDKLVERVEAIERILVRPEMDNDLKIYAESVREIQEEYQERVHKINEIMNQTVVEIN